MLSSKQIWNDRLNSLSLQYYLFRMTIAQQKLTLPNFLKKLSLKLNSLLFKKLVLLEQQQMDSKDVRHYDLQCEGIQILNGFFKTKQQNLLFKGFASIRQGLNLPQQKIAQTNPKINGTTRRTYLNTTFTASDASPIKEVFCPTIRSEKASSFHHKTELNNSSTNLQLLLNRVKLANSRQSGTYSFRQQRNSISQLQPKGKQRENYSNYVRNQCYTPKTVNQEPRFRTNPSNFDQKDVNYYDYYKSQMISTRNSRRQFIIGKFNQIQNKLHEIKGKNEAKKPQISKQILNQINNIKQRLKLQA